jgi:transposase
LEILILRHQLDVLVRKHGKPVRPNRAEKLTLAILAAKLKKSTNRPVRQLGDIIRIVRPETVIRWHRMLVRRKWTFKQKSKGGRPRISQELEKLIVHLAEENTRWGYGRIEGELLKLGFAVSITTIRNVLDRNGIVPAPVRFGSIGWRKMMSHYKEQLLACDFFTVETIWLRTVYVLFFIELGIRRVHLAGVTSNPDGRWVAQQARQLVWELEENGTEFRCLIHDNDTKFTDSFDQIFESEHIRVIPTPIRAPNANSFSERWVRTAREECLDHLLILNEAHLRRVLSAFTTYYNTRRPHQSLGQQSPIRRQQSTHAGPIQRRSVLGGIVNDYYRASDCIAVSFN